jgi:hypothetical protein
MSLQSLKRRERSSYMPFRLIQASNLPGFGKPLGFVLEREKTVQGKIPGVFYPKKPDSFKVIIE